MSLIGMFHYRKDPKKVSRAYRYATIAKTEGIEFYYFSSKCVDFERKLINGYCYENGEWIQKDFPFPDAIINHVGPITKKQSEVYNRLKKMIPFTSHPVGTKLSVYNRIKKDKAFIDYLIPYKKLKKPIDVFKFIKKHQKIILKPISGHHGNQVVMIKKEGDLFIVNENDKTSQLKKIELYKLISQLQKDNKMIIQKYISCKTPFGLPFDIRLHVQKDANGKWKNTLVYPKISCGEKVITNLGQGGQIAILKKFLYNLYGDEFFDVMRYLEVFSLQFAEHFDTLYEHDFDELGIDVGLDEDKKIWIYEVNWRPGHMFIESKAAYNAVLYANYLANKNRGEKDEEDEIKDSISSN